MNQKATQGQQVPPGIYECTLCGEQMIIEDIRQHLPACENCGSTDFIFRG